MNPQMPHSEFLQDIQSWVWKHFPTRQLSAADIFYAMQWAETGVPCCIFTDAFEACLRSKNNEFLKTGKLSSLHFDAERVIDNYRIQHTDNSPKQPLIVDDPYQIALERIADSGKKTNNPLLRDELRIFYQNMLNSRSENRKAYPDWNQRSESYYPLKARAIVDWESSLSTLLNNCFEMLTDQEKSQLQKLSPADEAHCLFISEEAQNVYKKRILNQKIAEYFDISPLLMNF